MVQSKAGTESVDFGTLQKKHTHCGVINRPRLPPPPFPPESRRTKQQLAEALRAGLTMAALDGDTQEQGSSIDVTQQGNSRGGSSEGTTDTTHGGTDGTTKLQQVQTTGKTLDRARSIAGQHHHVLSTPPAPCHLLTPPTYHIAAKCMLHLTLITEFRICCIVLSN